jgi:Tol biopolymer transport system component
MFTTRPIRVGTGVAWALLSLAAVMSAPVPKHKPLDRFLVGDSSQLVLLGLDGLEKERFAPSATNGALSPDGHWLACLEFETAVGRSKVVIQPRSGKGDSVTVPGTSVAIGEGCLLVWSADGRRLLISENRAGKSGALEYRHRVYELATRKLTELKLPAGYGATDWSADGKRLLTTARDSEGNPRIAWLNADGIGKPEFLTPDGEFAYGARLSPDGRRMLYQGGVRATANGRRPPVRLYVMDLASRKRVAVDTPGKTNGYCWSPDGTRIAYTWQKSLDRPKEVAERETLLITCDPDGKNRKTVTSRKYRPERPTPYVVHFFWVVNWR